MPKDETTFEYLTGCWKRLYLASREFGRLAYTKEEKAKWTESFAKMKDLIITYTGLTLEDPSMFPQPAG
jgi:ubiquitin conjugation factor E4 B